RYRFREARRGDDLPRRGEAGGAFRRPQSARFRSQARHQHRLPGGVVSVRAGGRLATREPGRLSAIPAAAGQFRGAVRGKSGAAGRHHLTLAAPRAVAGEVPMSARSADVPIAVLGAGSWGTALAIQFARSGRPVRLWGRDRERLAGLSARRRNERYLPSATFPPALEVEADLTAALAGAHDVLV